MGILNGVFRSLTSPVEFTARVASDFLDPSSHSGEDFGLDLMTLGASRLVRSSARASKETFDKIVDEFE